MNPRYLKIGQFTVFTRAWKTRGRRRNIILVHGLGVSSRYMVPLAEELAKTSNVFTIDLPGFGRSHNTNRILTLAETADVLSQYISNLNVDNPILVGNSYGCQVIIECETRHANPSHRIVLIGPTIDGTRRTWWQQVIGFIVNLQYERALKQAPLITKDYVECGTVRFIKTFYYALKDRPEEKLPRLSNPILILRGEHDSLVSQKWVDQLAQGLRHGTMVVIKNRGHALNYNAVRMTAAQITSYYPSISSQGVDI